MTDHVKDQLCARIEELESEKMELNEQIDALQQERGPLAAHLERLQKALHANMSSYWTVPSEEALVEGLADSPQASLAHLKSLWMAEGAQSAADSIRYDYDGHIHQDRIADYVDDVVLELLRQAEGR